MNGCDGNKDDLRKRLNRVEGQVRGMEPDPLFRTPELRR